MIDSGASLLYLLQIAGMAHGVETEIVPYGSSNPGSESAIFQSQSKMLHQIGTWAS